MKKILKNGQKSNLPKGTINVFNKEGQNSIYKQKDSKDKKPFQFTKIKSTTPACMKNALLKLMILP